MQDLPYVNPNEYVVQIITAPDGMNRVRMAVYWLEEGTGVTRGQVSFTTLAAFTDRAARNGCSVQILDN